MAAQAESLRFDSIFVTDHVVLPASMARSVYPYSTTGQLAGGAAQDYLEPLAMLGYLAHATKRVRLGTSVLVVPYRNRSEEHTSELQSPCNLVCRLLLEKKKKQKQPNRISA